MLLFIGLGVLGIIILGIALLFEDLFDLFDIGDGFLSGPAIGSFLSAFGFGGALALSAGASTPLAAAGGLGGGLVLSAVVAVVTRSIMAMPTDATPNSSNIVGSTGIVVTTIAADGIGEVNLNIFGTTTKMTAIADTELRVNTRVEVVEAMSSTTVAVKAVPIAGR